MVVRQQGTERQKVEMVQKKQATEVRIVTLGAGLEPAMQQLEQKVKEFTRTLEQGETGG